MARNTTGSHAGRIAMAAACAYAGVPPLKFSLLNATSAMAWAASLLILVAYAGPAWLPGVGISGWWSALLPATVIVVVVIAPRIARRFRRRADADLP